MMRTSVATVVAGLLLTLLSPATAPAAVTPLLTGSSASVAEGVASGKVVVRLTLDKAASRRIPVSWRTVDGTAAAGSDYRARSGTVTFRPGTRKQRVVVPIIDDMDDELVEKFFVRLVSERARVAVTKVPVKIKDDDAPPPGGFDVDLAHARATTRTFATAVSADDPTLKGGQLTATGPDGSVYTLTVPQGALEQPMTVTMTPWKSLTGIATGGGTVAGVDLKPHGNTFLRPVRLEVAPPGGADRPAVSFSYDTVQEGPYGYPVRLDPDRLLFDLMHFSGYGTVTSENRITFDEEIPEDPTKAMVAEMERLLGEERAAQLAGAEPDANIMAHVGALMQGHYDHVVEPTLAGIRSSCTDARTHAPAALSFARQAALMSLLPSETDAILDAVGDGAETCLREAIEPCVDPGNAEQMARVMGLWRQVLLLGRPVPDPDPLADSRKCKRILLGTITMDVDYLYRTRNFRHTEQFTLTYNLRMVGGSATWYDDGGGTWTVTGSRLDENLHPVASCPVTGRQSYTGSGTFHTGWIQDGTAGDGMAVAELNYFSTMFDYEPMMRGGAVGTAFRTSYQSDSAGGCEAYETDTEVRKYFPLPGCGSTNGTTGPYIYGDTIRDAQGQRAASFNCTRHEDDSDPATDTVKIRHTEISGVLVQTLS